jgi:hypothetical protein
MKYCMTYKIKSDFLFILVKLYKILKNKMKYQVFWLHNAQYPISVTRLGQRSSHGCYY